MCVTCVCVCAVENGSFLRRPFRSLSSLRRARLPPRKRETERGVVHEERSNFEKKLGRYFVGASKIERTGFCGGAVDRSWPLRRRSSRSGSCSLTAGHGPAVALRSRGEDLRKSLFCCCGFFFFGRLSPCRFGVAFELLGLL